MPATLGESVQTMEFAADEVTMQSVPAMATEPPEVENELPEIVIAGPAPLLPSGQ